MLRRQEAPGSEGFAPAASGPGHDFGSVGVVPGASGTAGAGASGGSAAGPLQATSAWTTDLLNIYLSPSDVQEGCNGYADPTHVRRMSQEPECSPLRTFCTTGKRFDLWYMVDLNTAPRPQPFTPPRLRADIDFVTDSGRRVFGLHDSDPNPVYWSASSPLKTKWDWAFDFTTSENGILASDLRMDDPDTGKTVQYRDAVRWVIDPCA
jgi:hypothetical protein